MFCDVESGRRDDRPEYQRMVSYVLEEGVDVVLVQYLDRFGRSRQKIDPSAELIEVPGVFPSILSEDDWKALQLRMDIRKGAPLGSIHRSLFLLSGIAKCGHCGGPMTGKTGAKCRGRSYRSYQCVNAKKARAACAFHNSHTARKLEPAVLEYLGHFSDPARVRERLQESGRSELKRKQTEHSRLEKRLAALDADFHKNLELLKKGLLNDEEFSKANEQRRDERASTEIRLAELREHLSSAERAQETASALPGRIRSFVESFQGIEPPKAKAVLQTILKAAYVWNDNRIELEFR